jgi:hypothetical protein
MTLKKTDIWLLDSVYDEGLIKHCERVKITESCSSCPNCMVVSVSRLREVLKDLEDNIVVRESEHRRLGLKPPINSLIIRKLIGEAFAVVLEKEVSR